MLKIFLFCDYCCHYILLLVLIDPCKFERIIFFAYFDNFGCFIVSHQSGIKAIWVGAIFTCMNDRGKYKDVCFKWYKLSFVEGQDERLVVCKEIESSRLCYIKVRFYVWWRRGLWAITCMCFIHKYVEDNDYNHIANETHDRTLWEKIKSLYASKSSNNKLYLLNFLMNLRYRESSSI